jgi:hypothetical protein
VTPQGRGTQVSRQRAAARVLERVQCILEETCEQDGRGSSLQEVARRKAYRAGINRALVELRDHQHSQTQRPERSVSVST